MHDNVQHFSRTYKESHIDYRNSITQERDEVCPIAFDC